MKYGEEAIKNARLEAWENPCKDRDYEIELTFPEFTSLCPRSGYPDFATIKIKYVPDEYIVELKSLKLYLNSFRDKYITHEEATNTIYDALKELLKPRRIEVIGEFNIRGGVRTVVKVSSEKEEKQE